jgi:opacity protein-like surface antigen
MNRFKTKATFLLLFSLQAACWGATPETPWEAGLNVGASVPVGSVGTSEGPLTSSGVFGTSARIEGSLFYQLQNLLQVGMEAGYSVGHPINIDVSPSFPYNLTTDSQLHIFSLGPVVKVGSWMDQNGWIFKPYAIAGMNWNHTWIPDGTVTFENPPFGSQTQGFLIGSTQDHFGINVGGGIDFKVYENFVFGAEARYDRIFGSPSDLQFVIPTAHIAYLF